MVDKDEKKPPPKVRLYLFDAALARIVNRACPTRAHDRNGARMGRIWPADSVWNRVTVSVDIGRSEGWIVHVDWITRTEIPGVAGRGYAVMALLRAKVFVADQAWQLARFIAHSIDVA